MHKSKSLLSLHVFTLFGKLFDQFDKFLLIVANCVVKALCCLIAKFDLRRCLTPCRVAPRVCTAREILEPHVSKSTCFAHCVFLPSLSLPWVSIGLLVLVFLLVSCVTVAGWIPL